MKMENFNGCILTIYGYYDFKVSGIFSSSFQFYVVLLAGDFQRKAEKERNSFFKTLEENEDLNLNPFHFDSFLRLAGEKFLGKVEFVILLNFYYS